MALTPKQIIALAKAERELIWKTDIDYSEGYCRGLNFLIDTQRQIWRTCKNNSFEKNLDNLSDMINTYFDSWVDAGVPEADLQLNQTQVLTRPFTYSLGLSWQDPITIEKHTFDMNDFLYKDSTNNGTNINT